MTDVYLISEQLLKSRTPINDNVDSNELRFCILTAQNINIQETLGEKLYRKILDDVSTSSISGNYKDLLDRYIQPSLIQWSYFHGLDNFFIKWVNVGLVQNTNEQGSAIDFRSFQYLKNNAKSTAEFYDDLTRRYLCAKASLFPEYNSVEIEKLQPQRNSAFRSSITLDPTPRWPSWYGPVNNK